MSLHKEIHFEVEIAEHLGQHGWVYEEGVSAQYDRARALFPEDVIAWVQESQPEAWQALAKGHGLAADTRLLDQLRQNLDTRGTLDVLRNGIELFPVKSKIALAQFHPASGINAAIMTRYAANRLRVVRQVRYSEGNENCLDLVFFLNGLPVATVELKSDFTQSVKDAVDQYRFDRHPQPKGQKADRLLSFPGGALVHFAVSNSEAQMTTRLAGPATRFLPFNKGDNGAAGNPPSPSGHRTSYLWEEVWERESFLDILGRYLVTEKDDKKKLTRYLFPRYHQLDATRKLLNAVKAESAGGKYLIQHSAGSGKTTALAVVREGAEYGGYRVEGFAPTSRAAQKLGEAGIETRTLQAHLAQGQKVDTGEKRLYIVDESSLASTRQMHEFVSRLHPSERVLLVGDTRQHESVEAGRIFAQLQEAGMKTVKLDEIVRQKDPELKQTVEQLARGEVGLAIAGLDRQGRIHEVRGPEERIAAIAKEYAKSPENTLVVSPDNRSRTEINQAIHTELQARGVVGKEEYQTKVLVPRQDLTGADRMWAARYNEGDVLRYSRTSQETGIPKGEYARVTQVDAPNNRLTVELKDGTEKSYDPRRQQGVSVYGEQERAFSTGDRVQLTAPVSEMKLANRELGTVERIAEGCMSVKMDGGREVQLDPVKHPHLDHGYAVTSHSSQGQTADRVLINVDTELGAKDLLNNRMAYVSVSRGAYDAQLFTDSREKLGAALGHDVSHTSAHTPDSKPPQRELAEAPKQEKSQDLDVGLSL